MVVAGCRWEVVEEKYIEVAAYYFLCQLYAEMVLLNFGINEWCNND